ncbi:FAD binding domain of DNA photolyase-domain-containing protein [Melampsora americana]|nr:FAD binding domain of DNA photolyase-domain-containing protein [Melampsora americana]
MATLKRLTSETLISPTKKRVKTLDNHDPKQIIHHEPITTPYEELLKLIESKKNFINSHQEPITNDDQKPMIVYWMRMRDLRISDNRAFSSASQLSKSLKAHLIVLHIFSPGDYHSHDRSPRRIDFVLRNLADLRLRLRDLNIPLYTISIERRKTIPNRVIDLLKNWNVTHLFANIEHEVDELRRDIELMKLCEPQGIQFDLLHDTCLVEPGKVLTKENKPYSVFSPWQKNWSNIINHDISSHLDPSPEIEKNDPSAMKDERLKSLFEVEIPSFIPGFKLPDEEAKRIRDYWEAGEMAANKLLDQFVNTSLKSKEPKQTKLFESETKSKPKPSPTILEEYSTLRNRPDLPGTSRLSAYLAAGVISPRSCVRMTLEKNGKKKSNSKLQVDQRETGIGMWQSELGWRDFYQHVLAAWPRVSMGENFNQKYDKMIWEKDESKLHAWKFGQTGFPFIDACMRQLLEMGYMHNRGRMCVAMFLTKDLLIDWRIGEKWFMHHLVDGDLGSNNGGWQWSSSTGCDSQPYFRIFAPLSQSEKSDPNGDFIRKYVPELNSLSGKGQPHSILNSNL